MPGALLHNKTCPVRNLLSDHPVRLLSVEPPFHLQYELHGTYADQSTRYVSLSVVLKLGVILQTRGYLAMSGDLWVTTGVGGGGEDRVVRGRVADI